MKSLDNLYDNMFNDNIQPTSDEALAARSIDDMYSDIMGTKTKEEY